MKNLEERLRALAKKGELNHLSIVPVAHRGAVGWSASYSPATYCMQGHSVNSDPVAAIHTAIDDWESAKKHLKRTTIQPTLDSVDVRENPWD